MRNLELLVPDTPTPVAVHRWATVTQASPLRVRIDGHDAALGITPDSLVGNLAVSDRVRVEIVDRRITVTGRSGGQTLADNEVTTAKLNNDAVTNAKLANMAQATIKGRASGAGTGDPTDLSASQVRTILGSARMGCSVARTTNQSIGNAGGSDTLISWNSQVADTDNLFAPTSTDITIPSGGDGIWAITLNINYSGAVGTGRAFMNLKIDGANIFRRDLNGNSEQFFAASWTIPLVATNVLTFGVYQSSGGSLNLQGSAYAYRVSI